MSAFCYLGINKLMDFQEMSKDKEDVHTKNTYFYWQIGVCSDTQSTLI